MTLNPLDELDRVRFAWPEPLVIELLGDHYEDLLPAERRSRVVKQHQELLRHVIEDDGDTSELRAGFLAECRACGLGAEVIGRIDQAVFYELTRIVGIRFRNSPRLRALYGQRLTDALASKPGAAPAASTAGRATARPTRPQMPPLRLRAAAAL